MSKLLSTIPLVAAIAVASYGAMQRPTDAQDAQGAVDSAAVVPVQALPEGHPPVDGWMLELPPGHPPVFRNNPNLPEGHPPIPGDAGDCPASGDGIEGNSGDAQPEAPEVIST
jgi:hypothetical protein